MCDDLDWSDEAAIHVVMRARQLDPGNQQERINFAIELVRPKLVAEFQTHLNELFDAAWAGTLDVDGQTRTDRSFVTMPESPGGGGPLGRVRIAEYQRCLDRVARGEIQIAVDPARARRFFTESNPVELAKHLGEDLEPKARQVRLLWEAAALLALTVCVAGFVALRWYGLVALPAFMLAYFWLQGRASVGGQGTVGATLLVVCSWLLAYALRARGVWIVIWLMLLPLPYFLIRQTYARATEMVRDLVKQNPRALYLLLGEVVFLTEPMRSRKQR
jgi:hypothetical protein